MIGMINQQIHTIKKMIRRISIIGMVLSTTHGNMINTKISVISMIKRTYEIYNDQQDWQDRQDELEKGPRVILPRNTVGKGKDIHQG